jgi:DNA-directed RNA polymerase specialized sigma24 family protein
MFGTTSLQALDADWAALTASRTGRDGLARWAADCPPLREVGELSQLPGLLEGCDLDAADAVLGCLLRHAAVNGSDDQLACRVLLRLLAPGLARLARTLTWLSADIDERNVTVLGTATELIRSCTWWRRRTRAIAKNLLMDTHMVLRRSLLQARLNDIPVGLPSRGRALDDSSESSGSRHAWLLERREPDLWATEAGEARLEVLHLLAWAQRTGVLRPRQIALLVDRELREVDDEQLGQQLGIAASSVRRRRDRALAQLRHAAADAASAGQRVA